MATVRKKDLPCNMDCFNCIHPDCINDLTLTRQQEWYFANWEANREKENERKRRQYHEKKAAKAAADRG